MAQRKEKIQKNTDKQTEQKKFLDSLKYQLDAYKSEYRTVRNEGQNYKMQSEMKVQIIQKSIDTLRQNFTDIENESAAFRRQLGPTVTDDLGQVAALNKSLRHENSIGSQIVSILKGT